MIIDILQNKSYHELAKKQVKEQLMKIVDLTDNFSITANIKQISFEPDLPDEIKERFSQYTLFALANYTFESIVLSENDISFEAGFGSENMGSLVTIPYGAIFQIIIDDSIVFVNPSATMIEEIKEEDVSQEERSKNAFSLNPKNKKFLD